MLCKYTKIAPWSKLDVSVLYISYMDSNILDNINSDYSKKSTLDTITNFCPLGEKPIDKNQYKKRRRAKAITAAMSAKLGAIESPLNAGYKRAYHCANYLIQNGNKVTSNYCNHRCCNVCNRIKSAKMLQGYAEPLLAIKNIHFVTCTAPNVTAEELSAEMTRMQHAWRRIYKNLKQRYKHLPIKGMYKLECTYNYKTKKFNPHFHFLISSYETAKEIQRQWLKQFPSARLAGQDIRPADDKSLFELFKYVTKSVVSNNYSAIAMDTIYQALQHRNTYYRVGIKKKVSEDLDDLQSQTIEFKDEAVDVWKWCYTGQDWYTSDGEAFINSPISSKTKKLINVVNNSDDKVKLKIIPQDIAFRNHRESNIKPEF